MVSVLSVIGELCVIEGPMFWLFGRVLLIVMCTDNANSRLSCRASSHRNPSPWNCHQPRGAVAVLRTLICLLFSFRITNLGALSPALFSCSHWRAGLSQVDFLETTSFSYLPLVRGSSWKRHPCIIFSPTPFRNPFFLITPVSPFPFPPSVAPSPSASPSGCLTPELQMNFLATIFFINNFQVLARPHASVSLP